MNNTKKIIFSFFYLFILLYYNKGVSGQSASAYWPLKLDSSLQINGEINAQGPATVGCSIKEGLNYATMPKIFSYELNPDLYFQFEIEPLPGYNLHVNEMSAKLFIYTEDISSWIQISTSFSPDFEEYEIIASEFPITVNKEIYTFNLNTNVPDGKILYLRIYPYGFDPSIDVYSLLVSEITLAGFTTPNTTIAYAKEGWCTSDESAVVTVTGQEGGTFSSSPGLQIDELTGNIYLAASQPGTYAVKYTYLEEIIATTTITVLPPPACSITGPTGPLVPTSTHTFTAPEGMAGYNWSVTGNAVITSNINEPSVTVLTGASNGTTFSLSLAVEDENGCTNTCSKETDINFPVPGMLPTATLSGTQSICSGNSADLTVNLTGEPPWSFIWTDGAEEHIEETNHSPYTITVHPAENTTYSLTGDVTDGNGYSNAAAGEAVIYFGPVTKAPEIIACANTTIEVPITVKSFSEVRDISLALKYNPDVMTFQGYENGDVAFGEGSIGGILVNDNSGEQGVITVSKTSEEPLPALVDDAILLRLLFNYAGGNTDLEWIDSPDDSWCSYSYLSVQDETGFETEDFCDKPTEAYYINGSVKELIVTGTDINPVADIHTITGTPVIIPVTVNYPDLAAQKISPSVFTDARISYGGAGSFPAGARIFKVTYNGNPVLSTPFAIGEKSEVLLSEILGTAPNPLLGHSTQTVNWKIFVDGINTDAAVPVKVDALAYTELNGCMIVLDNESFNISFAGATLLVTESIEVCGTESLQLTAEIGYPVISNLHPDIKADAKISTASAFPEGTVITWKYNNSSNGSYTLTTGTNTIMLSTIISSLPNPLQGHSGTDVWMFEISNAGLMNENEVTIEAVALLDNIQYAHSEDHALMTVNPIPVVTAVSLLTSTDDNNFTALAGDLSAGYDMCIDPAEEYHYLDIDELISSVPLSSNFERNAFYLDINLVPDGYYEYWSNKGVNASATNGWQAVMWDIISGAEPMFYISYDGTNYKLIDGLKHSYENMFTSLRISGDYPSGSYKFKGTVTDINGCFTDEFSVTLDLSSSPVITCPEDISVNNEAGKCGRSVSFAATATGSPVPEIIYTLDDGTRIESGHFFPVGITPVTATAINNCKTVDCTFIVTVTDHEVPEIYCPLSENVNVTVNNEKKYIQYGTDWDATIIDNCGVTEFTYSLNGATTGTGESLQETAFNMGTTTVTWTAVDAAGNAATCSFSVTVSGVNLTGTVKYYNKTETPMDNVSISLLEPGTEAFIAATNTDDNGEYAFDGLGEGMYNVFFSTDKLMRSINSTDAGQVNAWNVAQSEGEWPQIEKVRFLAGEVNEDNILNSGDAGIIQYYFLTLGTEEAFDKPWEFWKAEVPINTQPQTNNLLQIEIPAGKSEMVQNFYGLVSGDFNRSNIPGSGNVNPLFVKSANAVVNSLSLLPGDTLFAGVDDVIDLPICALSTMQVGAISLILDFPAEQFQILDVFLKDDSNQPAGYNVINNKLVIGWNSVNPLAVEAGEPLVTTRIKAIKELEIPFFFKLANNPLNELADESMNAIDNPSLRMDGLKSGQNVTGTDISERPESMKLMCWPNPFDEYISIRYVLPNAGRVNLYVSDVAGNAINILQDSQQPAGKHQLDFNGIHLIPGIYTFRLILTDKKSRQQMTTAIIIKK